MKEEMMKKEFANVANRSTLADADVLEAVAVNTMESRLAGRVSPSEIKSFVKSQVRDLKMKSSTSYGLDVRF